MPPTPSDPRPGSTADAPAVSSAANAAAGAPPRAPASSAGGGGGAAASASLAEQVIASLDAGVLVFAPDGRLALANPAAARLLGCQPAAGAAVESLLPPADPLLACLRQAIAGTELRDHDVACGTADGRRRWLRLSSTTLATAPGGVALGTMVVLEDASALKQSENHIGQVEKMTALGRLAASLAHEVGNPLGAVDIQLQLLEEDVAAAGGELAATARRRLHIARTEMRRLDNIVRNFLRFSRPPALRLKRVDPGELLGHLAALAEPEARERGLRLQLEVAPGLPPIEADENQLSQALLNLLINAFQASTDGARLGLTCRAEGGQVVLTIWDEGPGIPAEDLERVFELYYTTKDEGTGLGLSIAQRIVHQHGGVLTIESTPGRGTTAVVRLPVAG